MELDIPALRARIEAGETFRAVAAEVGADESTLRRRVGKIGRPRGPKPAADVVRAQELHEAGMTRPQIAAELGVSVTAVSTALSGAGIRPTTNMPDPGKHLTARQAERLRELEQRIPNRPGYTAIRHRDWSSPQAMRLAKEFRKHVEAGVPTKEIERAVGADLAPRALPLAGLHGRPRRPVIWPKR